MKEKNIKRIIISVLIAVLLIIPTVVQAYSGEIDPKNYINLPYSIDRETGGKITINSSVGTGYTVYYQYEFITSTQKNQLSTAWSEYNQDVEEYNSSVRTVEAERDAAYDEYERLREDASATEEQINEAYENYQNIFESTKQLIDSKKAELEEKLDSVYELYTTYTEANWEEAINNNVQVDVSEYSGEVHYILWVKLVNSDGTYYDVKHYSSVGTKEINLGLNKITAEIEVGNTVQLTATTDSKETVTWTSNKENIATVNSSGLVTGVAEGVATITAEVEGKTASCAVTVKAKKQTGDTEDQDEKDEEDSQDGLTWTDFSKAKVKLVREDYDRGYYIVVSNMEQLEHGTVDSRIYDIYVSTDISDVPQLDNMSLTSNEWTTVNSLNSIMYDKNNEIAIPILSKDYELSSEYLYIWVREKQRVDGEWKFKMQLEAIKVNRLNLPPLGTRINASFSDDATSISLYGFYSNASKGKINYKIGIITDKSILRSIKNGEANCFEKLMQYAKNANNSSTGSLAIGRSASILQKLNLVDGAYYFVYTELNTENGKFYSLEDVNLYKANNYYSTAGTHINSLLNYLDDDFVWNLSDEQTPIPSTPEEPVDDTVSKEKLPNTGKTIIIAIAIIWVIVIGTIAYKKYRNLREI